ncbi:MAG: hypothetical protein MUC93_02650 [Bacteroidales bacterium]|jgi:hypothetical protein|nr:hypothetical protein [Bacteroidales bacterium]
MKNAILSGSRLIIRKGILNILLIIALISPSCEKNNDVPLGTISVSVDGFKKSFNNNAKAEWLSVQNGYGLSIDGFKGEVGSSNEITITIASPYTISAKTYNNNPYGNLVQIKYSVNLIFFLDEFLSSKAAVTITEINSTHVKGTFSGNLIDSGGGTMEFSGGAFNVSF